MGSLTTDVRIAMLDCDTPVPQVRTKFASYGAIFDHLLKAAASRIAPHVKVKSSYFDVVSGEYPASISDFDVLLVTGSASSSYDSDDWIRRLDEYLKDVYDNHPRIKIFGSCFGHQIVCQSLLREFGCRVEKDPNGWELGVHEVQLTKDFAAAFPAQKPTSPDGPEVLRFQFIDSDHVKLPEQGLPKSWVPLGASRHCAVQGIYEQGRVLTYQGHFEFDRFVNTETVKVFGAKWEPESLNKALTQMDLDDDSERAAEIVLQFLL